MAVRPSVTGPAISREELEQMVSRAGLALNPGQVADLAVAWRQIAQLIALIPRDRPPADDMALTFRLPALGSRPKRQSKPKPVKAPAGRKTTTTRRR